MKGGGSLGFTNSYENHVLYRLQCAPFMLQLNHQCSLRVILFFIPLKTYLIAWKMRWVLLPDTNLNLRYKALDGFHLLVARAHIQVHFPRAESMKPQWKSLTNNHMLYHKGTYFCVLFNKWNQWFSRWNKYLNLWIGDCPCNNSTGTERYWVHKNNYLPLALWIFQLTIMAIWFCGLLFVILWIIENLLS